MSDITATLADFAVETGWEDLPGSIRREAKRTFLDHVGCALGGHATDRGQTSISVGQQIGGPPTASILGLDDEVSCTDAAFANAELMIALDYSNIVAGGHDGLYVIPTQLALAERVGASGRDLLSAIAVGLEVSARLGRGLDKHTLTTEEIRERMERESGLMTGNAYANFGAAAGASRLLGLDEERTLHALGIASHLGMIHSYGRWGNSRQSYMAKYGIPGWQNTGAIRASLLAEQGYTGDVTVLDDSETGYPYFACYDAWYPERITEQLGDEWVFNVRMHYKPYPCCGAFHSTLDCFYTILEEHHLNPDEIESVTAYCRTAMKSFPSGGIEGAQFDPGHVFAMAAHRIRRGPEWYEPATMEDSMIQKFREKVICIAHPEYQEVRATDPLTELGKVEVEGRGRTFTEERRYRRGTTGTDAMLSDEELTAKFRRNADHILSPEQIDRAIEMLWNLEDVEDVRGLTQVVLSE